MTKRIDILKREHKGKSLKEYFESLLNNNGIVFQENQLLSLEKTDDLILNIKKVFVSDNYDKFQICKDKADAIFSDILNEVSKKYVSKMKGYLFTDVYEECGAYRCDFSDLIFKSVDVCISSKNHFCFIVNEDYSCYIYYDYYFNSEKSEWQIEIKLKNR